MDDDLIVAEPPARRSLVQSTPYIDEVRELAFETWAFRAGRNAAETARILRLECDETPTITDRVIRNWVKSEDWGTVANERLEQMAPNIYAGIVTDLLHGAQAGANYLRRTAEGDPGTRDKNGRVDIGRVTAANIALQASGFAPRSTGERLQAPANATEELVEFANATEANRFWISGGSKE